MMELLFYHGAARRSILRFCLRLSQVDPVIPAAAN
jgi:hypothetical protein